MSPFLFPLAWPNPSELALLLLLALDPQALLEPSAQQRGFGCFYSQCSWGSSRIRAGTEMLWQRGRVLSSDVPPQQTMSSGRCSGGFTALRAGEGPQGWQWHLCCCSGGVVSMVLATASSFSRCISHRACLAGGSVLQTQRHVPRCLPSLCLHLWRRAGLVADGVSC